MSTLASDSFTRADAENLGSNWVLLAGADEQLGIFSNQVDMVVAAGREGSLYDGGITWPNDQWSQAKFVTATTTKSIKVTIRGSASAGRTYYAGGLDVGNRGDSFTDVVKEVASVFTDLANSGAADITAGSTVYLEAQGTTVVCKVGGVTKVTVTDASIASGKPGLWSEHATIDVAIFDDWSGGDFVVAGAGDDVLIRYGSMNAIEGSGLVTAAFANAVAAGAPGGGYYLWYWTNVVEDLN